MTSRTLLGPMLTVYLPRRDSALARTIDAGSGIVGTLDEEIGRVVIDFEGNRFGAENMKRYVERVMHAADRHITRYPTIARAYVEPSELTEVGVWDTDRQTLVLSVPVGEMAWWVDLRERTQLVYREPDGLER